MCTHIYPYTHMYTRIFSCTHMYIHVHTYTHVYTHVHPRTHTGSAGPAQRRCPSHTCTPCAAHMATPRGCPSIPAGRLGDKSCLSHSPSSGGGRVCRLPKGERASSTARVPSSAAAFCRCKFCKLLTKLFGLNQVRPSESCRGEKLRGLFAPPRSFLALQPSDFYCISPVPCAPKHRKWERSPSHAVTPQYFPCIRLQLRVHEGMRGRARIIKTALGNPTRLPEQLRYQ